MSFIEGFTLSLFDTRLVNQALYCDLSVSKQHMSIFMHSIYLFFYLLVINQKAYMNPKKQCAVEKYSRQVS